MSLGVTPFLIGSCLLPRVAKQNLIEGCLLPEVVNQNLIEGCSLSGVANQNLIEGRLLLETVNHPYLSVLTFATGFYTTTFIR